MLGVHNIVVGVVGSVHSKMSDYMDKIIHGGTVVSVLFAGMSLQDAVLVVPAVVSVGISIAAIVYKHRDKNRRFQLYREQELERTRLLGEYIKTLGEKHAAVEVETGPAAVSIMMDKVGKMTANDGEETSNGTE